MARSRLFCGFALVAAIMSILPLHPELRREDRRAEVFGRVSLTYTHYAGPCSRGKEDPPPPRRVAPAPPYARVVPRESAQLSALVFVEARAQEDAVPWILRT